MIYKRALLIMEKWSALIYYFLGGHTTINCKNQK